MDPTKQKIVPAEMAPGYAKEEAKKAVTDDLAERIETESGDNAAFDPRVFEIDNEIAQHYNTTFNEFEVTDPVEGYHYLWGRVDYRSHSEIMSRAQRYLGSRVPGYVLVNGPKEKFPECWNLKTEDGTRRIGDTQLYRIPEQVHKAIESRQVLAAKARDLGVSSDLLLHASRYPKYVRVTETDGDPVVALRDRARVHGGIPHAEYDRAMIETLTVHKIAEDARDGNLYGMPLERAVRKPK